MTGRRRAGAARSLSPRAYALPFLVCAAAFYSSQAAAQSLVTQTLLSNPFFDSDSAGRQLRLLDVFRYPAESRPGSNGLWMTFLNDQTVNTLQRGQHVGDLHGDAESMFASFGRGRRANTEFFLRSGREDGLFVHGGGNGLAASLSSTEGSIRTTLDMGRVQAYGGVGLAKDRAVGAGSAVANILPLLPAPAIRWDSSDEEIVVGLIAHAGKSAEIEVNGTAARTPAELRLVDRSESLFVPLDTSGWAWSILVRGALDRRTELFGLLSRADMEGTNTVHLNALALGPNYTSSANHAEGVALRRAFGSAAASLSYFHETLRASSSAYGLDPAPLGFANQSVDRVGYNIDARQRRSEIGATWEQRLGRRHALRFDYRWIESPISVVYGYTAASLLVGISQGGSLNVPDARTHLVHLSYTIPARGLVLTFDFTQIVPLRLSHLRQAGTPSPGAARRSYGGSYLSITAGSTW